MKLVIELDGNQINLVIKKGNEIVSQSSWQGEYTLSEQLLPKIDELLKKNKISKKEIEKVITKVTKISGVTSSRIVQTVAKAWNARQEA